MDKSEISFIGRFREALSQVDFDVLIKDILMFEQSFGKESRTDIRTHSTGQKRKWNTKTSEGKKLSAISTSGSGFTGKKPTCTSKIDKAVDLSEADISIEDRSKSCQASLDFEGDLVNEYPERSLESKSTFSRYKDASKPHKHIRTYSAKFNTGKSKSWSRGIDVKNFATTISSQSGVLDIEVKNIAPTVGSQSEVRDIEVKNIASTVGSQSEVRDIEVKNIDSIISSQSGVRDIEVQNIASTVSSQSGGRDIEEKNISSTVSSQSGSRSSVVKNIASNSSRQSDMFRDDQKPHQSHFTTDLEDTVPKTLLEDDELQRVSKYDKNCDTASADVDSLSNSLEVHLPPIANNRDDLTIVAPTKFNCDDIKLSNVAPRAINSDDLDLFTVAPTAINSDDSTLSSIAPTAINYDDLILSSIAPTPINSDELKLLIVAPTPINSDDLSISTVASTPINSDDLRISTISSTTFNRDELKLSIVEPTPINSDDLSISTVAPTPIKSDDLRISTISSTAFNTDELKLSTVAPTPINSDDLSISTISPTAFKRDQLKLSIVAPTTINSDGLALSTLSKLGIFSYKTDVKNKEFQNISQFESKQSTCEQIFLMRDLGLTSCSAKEVKDGTVTAKNVLSIPEFPKESNELDTDFVSSYGIQEAIKSKVECDFAGEQMGTCMHKNAKEMKVEENKVEHNERTRVAAMIGHIEAIGPSVVAIETQKLRDLAFPGSLCSILYEEVLKQDRAELESIAVILEQAQEKCFAMAPRTPEERKILLESQRQERLERSLKVQNANLDELTQRLFDTIIHFLETKVVETVKFAKYIPGFKTLDIADQITLIKDANLINLTPHVCRVINSETQLVTYLPGLHVGFEEFCENFSEEIKELLKVGESKGNQLNITAREESLLQAIFLVSTYERNSIKNPDRVEQIYRKLVSCLLHVVSMGPTPVFQRMDELSDMILFARHLREYHYRFMLRQIMNFSKDSNDLTIHEIYEKYV